MRGPTTGFLKHPCPLSFLPAYLPACLSPQVEEAQSALQQATKEREAIAGEKDAAVVQAAALQERVESLRQEVVEARCMGTPHGKLRLLSVGNS